MIIIIIEEKGAIATSKEFILETMFLTLKWYLHRGQPSQDLLVQSQQWKHQKNARNLFKGNNEDTRTTLLTSVWCLYC